MTSLMNAEPTDPWIDWAHDELGSARFGPFRLSRSWTVPTYFDDNLVARRHWGPPGAEFTL